MSDWIKYVPPLQLNWKCEHTLNMAASGDPNSMKGGLPVAISTTVQPSDQISAGAPYPRWPLSTTSGAIYWIVPANVSVLKQRPARRFEVPKSDIFTTPLPIRWTGIITIQNVTVYRLKMNKQLDKNSIVKMLIIPVSVDEDVITFDIAMDNLLIVEVFQSL